MAKSKINFDIILAVDSKFGIARNGCIPWKIKEDMRHFQNITLDNKDDNKTNVIIMGRKTADTLLKPLKNRLNVVITSNINYRLDEGFENYKNLDECFQNLSLNDNTGKVFIVGGSGLINGLCSGQYYRFCRSIYLTEIEKDFECDTKVELDLSSYDRYVIGHRNIDEIKYTFVKYDYVNREEQQYLDVAKYILGNGSYRQTRNAKTYSCFGRSIEFDLKNGYPLLTTKNMFVRGIIEELLFFLRGDTNTKKLEDKKVKIWSGNTTKKFIEDNGKDLEEFDMGPMYGYQWRHYNAQYEGMNGNYEGKGIDQLKNVIELLIKDPNSRRILMTTYNVEQTEMGVLYPCHGLILQFYVENNRISLQMYQRSADWALGVPFNIASYGALLHIIVNLVNNMGDKNYEVGRIIMVFGDYHIYSDEKSDHVSGIREQIKRQTYPFCHFELKKELKSLDDLNDLEVKDIVISNYVCHNRIKMNMVS